LRIIVAPGIGARFALSQCTPKHALRPAKSMERRRRTGVHAMELGIVAFPAANRVDFAGNALDS
jgi:hypothetical protein